MGGFLIIAGCVAIIVAIYPNLQSEIAPLEDRSSIRFSLTAAEGTSYSKCSR
ncbi:MAG: hypothetical protein WDM90_09660 [Ferruginibacter sp.]